jgi:hypothetical protein
VKGDQEHLLLLFEDLLETLTLEVEEILGVLAKGGL